MNTNNEHLSYWEIDSFLNYDVIIVGAGISGLSTAISLMEKDSQFNVLVLEKSIFPTGASTKNAGFACFGSLSELVSDIETMGEQKAIDLIAQRWAGLQKLQSRFSNQQIGYEGLGGYELFTESQLSFLDQLDKVNALMNPIFNAPVFENVSSKIEEFGINAQTYKAMVFNKFEGQIDTGKTIQALWKKSGELGVKIISGANVKSVDENKVFVEFSNKKYCFESKYVVIATNAFTKSLVPDLDLNPGRGQVLITKPIPKLKLKGTFHLEEGYYYFRNVGKRLLLGGGRNLDYDGEETTIFGIHPQINQSLKKLLTEDLLPNIDFEIDHEWSGIMAFGTHKSPIIKWVSNSCLLAVRLGGMGMAIGSQLGETVSELLIKKEKTD